MMMPPTGYASQEEAEQTSDLSGQSMNTQGAATGAASGAMMGAVAGPIGMLAGAAIGGIAGGMDNKSGDKKAKKAADAKLPIRGRSKMSAMYEKVREGERARMANMASLSQAAMDWANMQR